MNIKLIAIDIDGTLLDPDGKIASATRDAIHDARQAGIEITLATARRYCNTVQIANALQLDIPLILYDGALIVRHPHDKVMHSQPMETSVAQQAVDLLVRHAIQPVIHPLNGLAEEIWTGPADLDSLWQEAYFATYPEQMRRVAYDAIGASPLPLLRVVGFASEEAVDGLLPEVAKLHCTWTTIKRGSYGSAEIAIMQRGCSKASGVAALARSLHIPLNKVMAIGDNNNDIEMLQSVGWGVAMGQANESVKRVAKAVTASNLEDGVARAIERYALRRETAASNSRNRATCL